MNLALACQRWGIWVLPAGSTSCELAWSGPTFARWHALACTLQNFFAGMPSSMRTRVSAAPVQTCTLGLQVSRDGVQRVTLPLGALPVLKLLRDLLQEDPLLAGKVCFTSVQVNYNVQTRMHINGSNTGDAWLTSVGQFQGGML